MLNKSKKWTTNPKYHDQLKVVHKVASNYWGQEINKINGALSSIKVLNRTGSKIVCLLPSFGEFPQCICKIYFSGDGYQNEQKGYLAASTIKQVYKVDVPRVLQLFPENNAIVTEKIDLKDSRFDLTKIFAKNQIINWENLGLWLRRFHDSNISYSPDELFFQNKITRFENHVNKLGSLFEHKHIKKLDSIKQLAQAYFATNSQEWVFSHGDFGIGNIKTSSLLTYVIDFENVRMTPRGYEVVNFLSGLQSTIYFVNRKSTYKLLCDDFLRGYGTCINPNPLNTFFAQLTKLDIISNCKKQLATPGIHFGKPMYFYLEKSVIKSLRERLDKNEMHNSQSPVTNEL